MEPIPEERPLSDHELRLVRWMLEHGKPEATDFFDQLRRARVVSRCPCGCASIDFSIDGCPKPEGGMHTLADFVFGNDEYGAFVFEQNGVLSGLEVYGFGADAPKTLPEPQDLTPFLCD